MMKRKKAKGRRQETSSRQKGVNKRKTLKNNLIPQQWIWIINTDARDIRVTDNR